MVEFNTHRPIKSILFTRKWKIRAPSENVIELEKGVLPKRYNIPVANSHTAQDDEIRIFTILPYRTMDEEARRTKTNSIANSSRSVRTVHGMDPKHMLSIKKQLTKKLIINYRIRSPESSTIWHRIKTNLVAMINELPQNVNMNIILSIKIMLKNF